MNPEVPNWFKVDERESGHIWGRLDGWRWDTCLNCMLIRRRDRRNGPCKGKQKLRVFLNMPNDRTERPEATE